jgi:hypothetical protein
MSDKERYHKIPIERRALVREEQGNCCAYCGAYGCITIHHIVPPQKGKELGWHPDQIVARDNIVGLCDGEEGCHRTFDMLFNRFGLYYDDVVDMTPGRTEQQIQPREPARLYDTVDD